MGDIEENAEKLWVKLLGIGLLAVSCGTIIAAFVLTYKIITGIYHLLDKLIDKI